MNCLDYPSPDELKIVHLIYQTKEITEPIDLIFSLTRVEKDLSLTEEELSTTKDLYHTVTEMVRLIMPENTYQLITVGSYVIGCVTKYNMVVDCYLSLEKLEEEGLERPSSAQAIKLKLDAIFEDKSRADFQHFACETVDNDDSTLLVKDTWSSAAVRLFVMTSDMFQSDTKINRASAAIYHSNWLINLYNQTQNAWQTIKLFRIIRIWK